MRKRLSGLLIAGFVVSGLAFAADPKPKKPTKTQQIDALTAQVALLTQRLASMRDEVDEIHQHDIVQINQWLAYFNRGFEQLNGRVPQTMNERDKAEDKF